MELQPKPLNTVWVDPEFLKLLRVNCSKCCVDHLSWQRLPATEKLSLLRERKRLGHLQHGMMVLFVGELSRNPPSLTKIELYRDHIRLNDAKTARLATASSYLGFTLCQQSPSDALSPVLLKHPKVINPLLVRYYHPENLRITMLLPMPAASPRL